MRMFTKRWPQHERISVIKWIRWFVLWVPVSLFTQLLLLVFNGLMNKIATVTRIKGWHGLSNMDFHPPRLTWLQSILNARSASSKDQHWIPQRAPFPRVISQLPGDRLTTLDCFHHGRGSVLFLLEWTLTPDIDFPFLHVVLLPKRPSVDLQNALSPSWYSHSISSDQRNHFTALEEQQWAQACGILTMFPTTPKQLAWQIIGMTLWRLSYSTSEMGHLIELGQGSPEAIYALNQHPTCGAVSPIARIYGSALDSRVKRRVAPLIITLNNPLAKLLLPVPMTFCSEGLEVFVPKGGMLSPRNTTMIKLN